MNFKNILNAVAPILGTMIGGPLGGIAVKAISETLLGRSDATEDEVAYAILNASPSDLLKLKKTEADTKIALTKLGLDEKKLRVMDRKDARKREIATKDKTPSVLAYMLGFGFFSLVGTLIFYKVPPENLQTLDIMIGSIGTAFICVVTYYFGSSAGSRLKNFLLSKD